jgi:RNA polymerase sigma-70 factor (ECF subfamily)
MPVPVPMSMPSAELELAQRCAAGDRGAQHAFFIQQRAQVHRTLFRVLGTNRQIEDLIQETFIAAFRSLGSFRGESSLNTWIDTVATRVVYRHLSRREPRPQHLQAIAALTSPAPDPERQASAREALRRLYAVLDRVDAKLRIAYTLHVIDDRPIKQVARITRASSLAVKNRIWRARRIVHQRALRDPLLSEFLAHDRTHDRKHDKAAP